MTSIHEIPLNARLADSRADARETARLWIVDGEPTFVIGAQLWDEPEMWGLLIAEFIQHIATVYQAEGFDRKAVLQKITTALYVEVAPKLLLLKRCSEHSAAD